MASTTIHFTKKTLDGLTKTGIYHDETSPLFLDISKTGRKVFKVQKRLNRKVIKVTIGVYGEVTLTQAKNKALEAVNQIANGINPNEAKRAARTKHKTLSVIFEDYIKSKALKPSTVRGYKTSLNNVLHSLADKPITEINYAQIAKAHKEYKVRSTAEADRAMRLLKALFNFAMDEIRDANGLPVIVENPVKKLGKNKQLTTRDRKIRKLETDQVKPFIEFFEAMTTDSRPFYQVGANLVLAILYHGTRLTETASIKWEQVDFKYKRFYLTETKNGRRLWLPMTTESEKVFKRQKSLSTGSDYVFPSVTANKPISDVKKPFKALLEETGIEITAHDLRRTFLGTGAKLGFNDYLLKQLANHAISNDVTAGYVIQSADELREPSQKITDKYLELTGRITPDNQLDNLVAGLSDAEKNRLIIQLTNKVAV